jgi:hypothetical protein
MVRHYEPMSEEIPAPHSPEIPAPATTGVLPPTTFRRGLRWFLAEFLVVVAGVFVAMLLNAWYQDRTDTQSRLQYLTLLSRDLRDSIQSMDEAMKFEEMQVADAVLLYRAMSAPKLPADTRPLSTAVSHLSQRRTMLLKSTTYDDLVNTGHFHLIDNAALRDQIADFYQQTSLEFEIINKNNTVFVDENFAGQMSLSGLVLMRPGSNLATTNASDERVARDVAGGYLDQWNDLLWQLPPDDPRWAMARSNVVWRLRVSRQSAFRLDQRATAARTLLAAVEAERSR